MQKADSNLQSGLKLQEFPALVLQRPPPYGGHDPHCAQLYGTNSGLRHCSCPSEASRFRGGEKTSTCVTIREQVSEIRCCHLLVQRRQPMWAGKGREGFGSYLVFSCICYRNNSQAPGKAEGRKPKDNMKLRLSKGTRCPSPMQSQFPAFLPSPASCHCRSTPCPYHTDCPWRSD